MNRRHLMAYGMLAIGILVLVGMFVFMFLRWGR